jgi:hypothetical protein
MFSKKDVFYFFLSTLIASTTVFLLIIVISSVNEKPRMEQQFYDRCNAACQPNGVFSTSYNRCMCAVGITYKELK